MHTMEWNGTAEKKKRNENVVCVCNSQTISKTIQSTFPLGTLICHLSKQHKHKDIFPLTKQQSGCEINK